MAIAFVIALLRFCRGTQFAASPHHSDRATWTYVFKPVWQRVAWYIKAYWVANDHAAPAVIISVPASRYGAGADWREVLYDCNPTDA